MKSHIQINVFLKLFLFLSEPLHVWEKMNVTKGSNEEKQHQDYLKRKINPKEVCNFTSWSINVLKEWHFQLWIYSSFQQCFGATTGGACIKCTFLGTTKEHFTFTRIRSDPVGEGRKFSIKWSAFTYIGEKQQLPVLPDF